MGIDLNVATRECHVDGEPVELSRREFDVLRAITLGRGAIVSRFDIVKMLDLDVEPRTIDQYLSRIRRKVGEAYIRTVPHFGWRLIVGAANGTAKGGKS